jgi:hypothetical protein
MEPKCRQPSVQKWLPQHIDLISKQLVSNTITAPILPIIAASKVVIIFAAPVIATYPPKASLIKSSGTGFLIFIVTNSQGSHQ